MTTGNNSESNNTPVILRGEFNQNLSIENASIQLSDLQNLESTPITVVLFQPHSQGLNLNLTGKVRIKISDFLNTRLDISLGYFGIIYATSRVVNRIYH